jgi:hypothetical protein|tara:strand:+ start:1796 stop:1972 length:177 start_codon:yes stop_codon:yes gene_type:complete
MKTKEEKLLQVVNLAPSESIIEKLVEMHPMRQVFWASIIQMTMLGLMGLAMFTIGLFA